MRYRRLGRANVSVSEIGLGCWTIGGRYWNQGRSKGWSGPLNEHDIIDAIRGAVDRGVNHFDTADIYGYGRSERLLGQALEGHRDEVLIATKVGWAATTAPHVYDPLNIRRQCEQSLRNLRADCIDIYYFHHCEFGDRDCYLPDAIETMERLQAEGSIRWVGLSGYSYDDLSRVACTLNPVVIQSWADIEHDEFIRDAAPLRTLMDARDMAFVGMMPLGQGRLVGKYDPDSPPLFPDGDNRAGSSAFSAESLTELQPRLDALRRRFGAAPGDLARVALQFVLAQPVVASVIPGFRDRRQVESNVSAADCRLRDDDLSFIREIFPRRAMPPHPWTHITSSAR